MNTFSSDIGSMEYWDFKARLNGALSNLV